MKVSKRSDSIGIAIAAFTATLPVAAHHSDAGLDMESIVAFEGTVNEFAFRNPHSYVVIGAPDETGAVVDWELQMGPVNILSRRGWRRDTLQPGDSVTVRAHVAIDGRPYGVIESIDKPGGLGLATPSGAAPTQATTTTLEGKWMSDRGATMNYPGGFDGFFHALMTPNDAGRAAQAAYDPLSDENPEATCIGRPTPAALVSSSIYLMEIDIREQEEIVFIVAKHSARSARCTWMAASIRIRASGS